jgi:hypothetical protein
VEKLKDQLMTVEIQPSIKHVVMFSGGIGSWAAAKRVAERYGSENLYLLFSDVKGNTTNPDIGEDEDTYRFIKESAVNVGGTLITVADGRNIWEVFHDKKFLGNSRLANCSHELKQKPARKWLDENCDPETTIVYVGIDWSESHRLPAVERNYLPFKAEAPLTEPPFIDKQQMIALARSQGLKTPRLYDLGFAHNNCGGGCVRAGQAQFKKLLDLMPDRYAEWENQEKKMQDHLDRSVTILSETVRGERRSLSLTDLRERSESQPSLIDLLDIGGCGCFVQDETDFIEDGQEVKE